MGANGGSVDADLLSVQRGKSEPRDDGIQRKALHAEPSGEAVTAGHHANKHANDDADDNANDKSSTLTGKHLT